MRLIANMVCLIFLKKMYSHLQVIISLRFQIFKKKPSLFTHVYIKDFKGALL